MRKIVSFLVFTFLFLSLGALALLAAPGGLDFAPGALESAGQAAGAAQSPNAPAATEKYNVIAMPLDAQQQFQDAGESFNAAGLAGLVGAGVQQVLTWNANTNSYLQYLPGLGGDNFNLEVGGVYWLVLDATAGDLVSFVGDVPAQGSVSFTLVRPTSGCTFNEISLPLDEGGITTPQALADALGNVEQVLAWNAATNSYLQYLPGLGGDSFDIKIGYPYTVCLQSGGATQWP